MVNVIRCMAGAAPNKGNRSPHWLPQWHHAIEENVPVHSAAPFGAFLVVPAAIVA